MKRISAIITAAAVMATACIADTIMPVAAANVKNVDFSSQSSFDQG